MTKWISGLAPIVLLVALLFILLSIDLPGFLTSNFPPSEALVVERIALAPDEIVLHVINDGADPITVAQVMVNGAWWNFSIEPGATLARLERGRIALRYPWVEGNTEHVSVITATGATFDAEIEVAVESPTPDARFIGYLSLLGFLVGVVPVSLGLLWLPFLRKLKSRWMGFFLSLTAGLLTFLGVDSLVEAVELVSDTPDSFQGFSVLAIGALLAFLSLQAAAGKVGTGVKVAVVDEESRSKTTLAYSIAFGIGVHNLGEGLAIGGAYAVGEIGLGLLLVLGFMIHNVTEGIAIVAPVAKVKVSAVNLILMGLLAGAPTIVGTWIGGFAYSAIWAVFFLGIGAGAIFQVIYAIVKPLASDMVRAHNFAGLAAGLALMYGTALLLTV